MLVQKKEGDEDHEDSDDVEQFKHMDMAEVLDYQVYDCMEAWKEKEYEYQPSQDDDYDNGGVLGVFEDGYNQFTNYWGRVFKGQRQPGTYLTRDGWETVE
jgi:hypothetical protein